MSNFHLQATCGRLFLLNGPSKQDPLVHIRLQKGPNVELLVGATSYAGKLNSNNVKVLGMNDAPCAELAAVLLGMPSTTAYVSKSDGPDGTESRTLQLQCCDKSGVSLIMDIHLKEIDGTHIIRDAFQSLFIAVSTMEAVITEVEGRRPGRSLEYSLPSLATNGKTLKALSQPILVKGKPIKSHPAYRRAVVRDVADIGNRAYFLAGEATKVRDEMLERRAARKLAEKQTREARRAQRDAILKRRGEGVSGPSTATNAQVSLFDDRPEEEPQPPSPRKRSRPDDGGTVAPSLEEKKGPSREVRSGSDVDQPQQDSGQSRPEPQSNSVPEQQLNLGENSTPQRRDLENPEQSQATPMSHRPSQKKKRRRSLV